MLDKRGGNYRTVSQTHTHTHTHGVHTHTTLMEISRPHIGIREELNSFTDPTSKSYTKYQYNMA